MFGFFAKQIRKLRNIYDQVMALPDSPRKIAQGVALGTALEFLPLPFISIPISFLVAKLLRFNAVAAVLAVIFFKWAFPFCFIFDYYIGKMLIGDRVSPPPSFEGHHLADPHAWIVYFKSLSYPFLIGAAIDSVVAAVVTYFVVKALLDYYRRKRKPRFISLPRPKEIK